MNKYFTLFIAILLLAFAVMNLIEGDIALAVVELVFGVGEMAIFFTDSKGSNRT